MTDYARGLEGVIANESALSNVIGDIGELSYLGYHIDELVNHCTYEEVVYLLHKGRLPNRAELTDFELVRKGEEPFLIRETARKFQWTRSMVTVWRRK